MLNTFCITGGSAADSFALDPVTRILELRKELDRESSPTYDLVVFVRVTELFKLLIKYLYVSNLKNFTAG